MSKQTRLKIILDYIKNQEEIAARELSVWLQKQHDAQQQIIRLKQYYSEYAGNNSGGEILGISKLQNHQNFLAKLGAAMEQQKSLLSGINKEIDTRSQTWQKTKSQREGLEKIMHGYQKQAQAKEERRLQTDLDTYASRGNSF